MIFYFHIKVLIYALLQMAFIFKLSLQSGHDTEVNDPQKSQLEFVNEFCEDQKLHMNPALPFIVLEPLMERVDIKGRKYKVWCEGVIFSELWGIAPPNCFTHTSTDIGSYSSVGKYIMNFIEDVTYRNVSYLAVLRTFLPPGYSKVDEFYCNYIGLFQIRNFRFNFKNVITLPQVHDRRDLSELLTDCRIIGATLGKNITIKAVPISYLTDTSDYCHEKKGECAPLKCKNYNFNVTYIRLNLPKARYEQHCNFDPRYQWGASLMCQESDGKWTFVGIGTMESKPTCTIDDTFNFQAFTRIDAYLEWIIGIIIENGGFEFKEA